MAPLAAVIPCGRRTGNVFWAKHIRCNLPRKFSTVVLLKIKSAGLLRHVDRLTATAVP